MSAFCLLPAILAAFALLPPPAAAQRLPAPLFARGGPPVSTPVRPADDFDGGKAAAAGVLGTISGLAVGALIGHQFDSRPCEFCVEFGLLGAFVGASVGSPLAVHHSNGRRGHLGPAVLASVGIGIVGTFAASAAHDARILLAVPILQIASAITIERRTARD